MGNDGISPTSAMFQSENIRRKRLLNETAPITNPAGKFIDEDRAKMTVENDLRLIRKRFYLRKNRRAVRTHVKQMDHARRMAERARIFTKTSQQLRYLEVLNDIEERKVNQTYQTKGLIKSPEAARMKAGSYTSSAHLLVVKRKVINYKLALVLSSCDSKLGILKNIFLKIRTRINIYSSYPYIYIRIYI